MHDTTIKMKDGTVHCSPMWDFRPKEGWMTLVNVDGKLYFRDMISAVTENQRIRIDLTADQDELERARRQGWDGK